ncbi:chromatin structure-remodeling complex subunit RSC7 [Marasmius crinis-equi]|uniref:Chromatin structure-remodeling complex subunit RSC7 n=1 Tax=Marasmius crinis-equi TaxID=585013 RepID=A0ABR3FDP0_9AGAR
MDVDEEVGVEGEAKERPAPIAGGKPFVRVQGQVWVIEGDELIIPDDPKGDEKVDRWGNLLGGRKFKSNTFILPNRHPERQYMLAIDAARTSGFRDSLYYFRRNPLALKLNATQAEKEYLIGEGKLGSHLKTRSVTLVTARSAFKMHGSKMLIDGRWVTDDYYEEKVLAEITARGLQPGDLVGELPDPNATSAKNIAAEAPADIDAGSGGGSSIYRAGGPTTIFGGSGWGPYSDGPLNAVRKSLLTRDGVNEENWMWRMAEKTSEMSEEWRRVRERAVGREIVDEKGKGKGKERARGSDVEVTVLGKKRKLSAGVDLDPGPALGSYDPHTGLIFYRSSTQPTLSQMEPLPDSAPPGPRRVLGGAKAGSLGWGIAWLDTVMELPALPESEGQEPDAALREWLLPGREERERLLREVRAAGILLEDVLIRPDHSIVKQVEDHYLPKLFHHIDKEADKAERADIAARNLYFNGDGTGVAFYSHVASQYGTATYPLPQCYKTTMPPTNDINFKSLCQNTCSKTVFAHVRMATSDVHQFNSHPFAFGRHIFMHNGGISDFAKIRRDVCTKLSHQAFEGVHGTTDSEHLGALYMTHLGEDWGKEYSLEEMKSALERAIGDVLELQKKLPGAKNPLAASSLNLCTTDGNKLVAFRFRNSEAEEPPSLYISTKAGVTLNRKFPGHPNFKKEEEIPEEHAAGLVGSDTKATEDHGDHLIVASEPTTRDVDEWDLVPKNQAVMVQFADGKMDLRVEKIEIPETKV